MIVVKERDLGGLPPAALREILNLPDDVLIVVVHTLDDDGPRIAPLEPEVDEPQAAGPAFSSRVVVNPEPMAPPVENPLDVSTPCGSAVVVVAGGACGHGGDSLRQTAPGETSISGAVPTIKPPNDGRPPRLPEHGCTWAQLAAAAESVRLTARMGNGGVVVLHDALAGATAHTWASAIAVINARIDYANLGYAR